MELPTDIITYSIWSGYATIALFVITLIAWIAGWGLRFRLFGTASFMGVVTASIFALSLGLFTHTTIPGAARYSLVYDNGYNKAVIVVPPDIEKSAIAPTLRQAVADLSTYGRTGTNSNNQFRVAIRTVLHPQDTISIPLYLGQAMQPFSAKDNEDLTIQVFENNLETLSIEH
ncbi:MAG: Ycf51 family protein [Cyanobacteria bacterium P01_F01_bin.143]